MLKTPKVPKGRRYLFVSLSDTPWFGPWYVRQKLMSQFAKGHKVIYASSRKDVRLIWRHIRQGNLSPGIRFLNWNLVILNGVIMFPKIHRWKRLDAMIELGYCLFIKILAFILGYGNTKVLYVWESKFSRLLDHFKKYILVYHAYDAMHKYVYQSKKSELSEGERFWENEKKLVDRANLFYAVSPALCDHYEQTFQRRPQLMVNGVSEHYFDLSNPEYAEKAKKILSPFPNTRICFFGSIIGALKLDLITESSPLLRDHHFLFLGSVQYQNDEKLDQKVDHLLAQPNVHQIGPFEQALLPYLLNEMDIFLLLYDSSDRIWTYYSSPAKLFEYMAIGKPIISTPHPFIQKYHELVNIVTHCNDLDLSIKKIECKGSDYTLKKESQRLAKKHIWSDKINKIIDDLKNI